VRLVHGRTTWRLVGEIADSKINGGNRSCVSIYEAAVLPGEISQAVDDKVENFSVMKDKI
jgi:hypothetical protein